jgi:hypothetical protein
MRAWKRGACGKSRPVEQSGGSGRLLLHKVSERALKTSKNAIGWRTGERR